MSTIVVLAVIAAATVMAIRSIVRNRKNGKSCGGDCGHCDGCR
ncbi:MAG: FeoB-associated Cys-rich membrane protein [Lachnospiraceae bacterium]|nr:FeoB-associated Cys-rich membrane protein [Lachnospiraceae bacterium]